MTAKSAVKPVAAPTARARRHISIALGNALALSVDGGLGAAAEARAELTERLGPKLDPAVVQLARLLLSELVNNCVLHGAAAQPGTWIDITASVFPQTLRIEVSDGGPSFQHEALMPPADQDSGRGLYLVEQMATRWGISERGRTRVWFELPRSL